MYLLKIKSFFLKKKKSVKIAKEEKLLAQYDEGIILQIDNNKDNKEYFKKIREKK